MATHPFRRSDPAAAESYLSVLDMLVVPELVFTVFTLGLLAVLVSMAIPGLPVTGVAGAAILVAGAAGLASVPITPAAAVLLSLAGASMWFEVRFVPGLGLYVIIGWHGLVLAGFCLHGTWSGAHQAVVLTTATMTAAGTYLAGRRAWQRIDNDPLAESPFLTSRHTIVLDAHGQRGHAVLDGLLWAIQTRHSLLCPGQRVRVTAVDRQTLTVEPDPQPDEDNPTPP